MHPIVQDESKGIVNYNCRYKKPVAYNLLLPSIHSSRDDNVLLTEGDTQGAVTAHLEGVVIQHIVTAQALN
ncbi:hypothetical protein J6590_085862 [Homalodisca vitripennis]|nr:hypothetical protein J6590_085862 [Homalodisca vitripennis]